MSKKILVIIQTVIFLSCFSAVSSLADMCNNNPNLGGGCIERVATQVDTLHWWKAETWAYYCTSDYPYVYDWKNNSGSGVSASCSFGYACQGAGPKFAIYYNNASLKTKPIGLIWSCTKKRCGDDPSFMCP